MESKTKFQQALRAFEDRVGAELTRQFAIDDTAVVSDLGEMLVDLANAQTTLRKAARMKSVRREYLAHLRYEVAACRAELAAELNMWCNIHAVSATSLLAYVRKVKREIEHFVCESQGERGNAGTGPRNAGTGPRIVICFRGPLAISCRL